MQLNCKPAASVLNYESLGLECAGQCSKPSGQTFYIWSQNYCLKNALNTSQCCTQVPAKTTVLQWGARCWVPVVKFPFLSQQSLFNITNLIPAPTQPSRQAARQDKHWILHTQAGAPGLREHKRTARCRWKPERRLSSAKAPGLRGSAPGSSAGSFPTGPLRDWPALPNEMYRARLHLPLLFEMLYFSVEKAFLHIFSSCIRKKPFYCSPLTLQCCFSYFI